MKQGKPGWWRRQLKVRPWVVIVTLLGCGLVVGLGSMRATPEVLIASGNSSELGVQSTNPVRWKVKLLVRGYLEKVICSDDPQKLAKARSRANEVMAAMAEVYRVELQAAADTAGVDPALLTFGNSFVDLGSRALGCRSTVVRGGRMLHAHNLDWDNLGGMAKWSVVVTRRQPNDGRFRTVSVGFPGLVGALDVINEHGLSLSFNQLGTGAEVVTEPVFIMIRRIAEHCKTFEEAQAELINAPPGMPFIITLCSATERKAAIFERFNDAVFQRDLNDRGYVAAANGQQRDQHGVCCVGRIMEKDGVPKDIEALKTVLRHDDVLATFNLYSVIWDFEDNRLYLASGALPAATGPYREYALF